MFQVSVGLVCGILVLQKPMLNPGRSHMESSWIPLGPIKLKHIQHETTTILGVRGQKSREAYMS